MPQLSLILSLMFLAIIFGGVEACREDVDFATQSSVSPSPTTDDGDDQTTASPSPSVSPTASPSASPSASISPTPTETESETPTETPTPEDSQAAAPNAFIVGRQSKNALQEIQRQQDQLSSTVAGLGTVNSQEIAKENWLGKLYDSATDNGQVLDSDGDGFSDLLEADYGTNPKDASDYPRVHVTNLFDRLSLNIPDMESLDQIYQAYIGSNPSAIDRDNDGLPDDLENLIGSDPLSNDTDKDGILDGREFFQGSDPTIPEYQK